MSVLKRLLLIGSLLSSSYIQAEVIRFPLGQNCTKQSVYIDRSLFSVVRKRHQFFLHIPPLGVGKHTIKVIDRKCGLLYKKTSNRGCNGLTNDSKNWCSSVPEYWKNRQHDTKLLLNDNLSVGINNSYGGFISQLYSKDKSKNLITEHGGAGIQLSLWGYGEKGEHNDPNYGVSCDALPGLIEVPFNPIQAQGSDCSWERRYVPGEGNTQVWSTETIPFNFTKASIFEGMVMSQTVTLMEKHFSISYDISYSGTLVLQPHPQEIPGNFFALEDPTLEYQRSDGTVATIKLADNQFLSLNFMGHGMPLGTPLYDTMGDTWYSLCDTHRCVTEMIPNEGLIHNISFRYLKGQKSVYVAPIAYFAIVPGLNIHSTIAVSPYRYDSDLIEAMR